ncbi:MAG: cation-translocating P-type ATPase [Planctomycetota bacterium]
MTNETDSELPGEPRTRKDGLAAARVAWWALTESEVLRRLEVDAARGLASGEVLRRRAHHGENQLRAQGARSALRILVAQLQSVVMVLLALAAAVSLVFGDWVEAAAMGCVLVINALLGFVAELRAERSMESLRALTQVSARVRRQGEPVVIAAAELVPGDIVVIEAGDLVSADLRILASSRLQASEAALTGESLPVAKSVAPVAEIAPLADRTSMLFGGTSITRGSGEAVVVATGMTSELGRIARLVDEAEEEVTPLEKGLEDLGRRLIGLTLAVAAVPVALGLLRGRSPLLMVETGIALAVAAIPEGLPIVATLALARGMWRMARRQAIVNRLAAVETLGAINTILTDKTGTLTENRLAVSRLVCPGDEAGATVEIDASAVVGVGADARAPRDGAHRPRAEEARTDRSATAGVTTICRVAVLCNNADWGAAAGARAGDPLEVALLEWAVRLGCDPRALRASLPEFREDAFDARTRRMATLHRDGAATYVAVKGAAEAVVAVSTRVRAPAGDIELTVEAKAKWLAHADRLAGEGLRVLAVADRCGDRSDDAGAPVYRDLVLAGLIAFLDPPRADVKSALAACHRAGIRVVMATGDHAATARTIGAHLGLVAADSRVFEGESLARLGAPDPQLEAAILQCSVFARVEPEQKLRLIEFHQRHGGVVAMTGDGVNDAPALRKADVGIAMGQRGTQVACEAADVILRDDSFATIVAAVRQGRVIFANIRKFVCYLLACNLSEVFVVTIASALAVPLPILPLQVLFLNLVTDVFPALALAFGEGAPGVMERGPRPAGEPILTGRHWRGILVHAAIMTACVLAALVVSQRLLRFDDTQAVTVSFLTLAIAQLGHVVNVRGTSSSLWRNDVTQNPWVWGAILLCLAIILLGVWTPLLARLLNLQPVGLAGWSVVVGFGLVPAALGVASGRRPWFAL